MKIDLAASDEDILACFPVIRHLRDLGDPATLLRRVRSQQLSGYHLAALRDGGTRSRSPGFAWERTSRGVAISTSTTS